MIRIYIYEEHERDGQSWLLILVGFALGLPTTFLSFVMTFFGSAHNDGNLTLFLFVCYPLQGLFFFLLKSSKFVLVNEFAYDAFLLGCFLFLLIQFPLYAIACVQSIRKPLAKRLRLCAKFMLAHSVIAFVALCLFFLGIWR
jgi:hypothetical protein